MSTMIAYSIGSMTTECIAIEKKLVKPHEVKSHKAEGKGKAFKVPKGIAKIVNALTKTPIDKVAEAESAPSNPVSDNEADPEVANEGVVVIDTPFLYLKHKILPIKKEGGRRRVVRSKSKPHASARGADRGAGPVAQKVQPSIGSDEAPGILPVDLNDKAIQEGSANKDQNITTCPASHDNTKSIAAAANMALINSASQAARERRVKAVDVKNDQSVAYVGVPLMPRDPQLPPLRRMRASTTKIHDGEPRVRRQLRAKIRPARSSHDDKENLPLVPINRGNIKLAPSSRTQGRALSEDRLNLVGIVEDVELTFAEEAHRAACVENIVAIPSTSSGITSPIISRGNASSIDYSQIPQSSSIQDVLPSSPSSTSSDKNVPQLEGLEIDDNLLKNAAKAQERRGRKNAMSREDRANQLKVALKIASAVEEAMADSVMTSPSDGDNTNPSATSSSSQKADIPFSRHSTNPRRIGGVIYHGMPGLDRGKLLKLRPMPYTSPTIFKKLDLKGVFDGPLAGNMVSPEPTPSSAKASSKWWNVGNIIRDAGAALRLF